MPYEFKITRRVEFSETDMAGIVHFSNFCRYMEYAEHAFFRSLGHSVQAEDLGVGWPRVTSSCEFESPLRFEDELQIHLIVAQKKTRSIRYNFVFHRVVQGVEQAPRAGTGSMTVVCVQRDKETGKMSSTEIPPAIADQIDQAPAQLIESSLGKKR
jgi:acyl-CoA thioester hydrolase